MALLNIGWLSYNKKNLTIALLPDDAASLAIIRLR